ncbi:MAG: hypothetical protein AAFN41_12185, partial [Planctomycetota bacterium]
EQFAFASGEAAWIISPYTGDHDGLLLLSDLLADKGGQFEALEVRRALFQLVQGIESTHLSCAVHGEVSLGCVQVDRAGKLLVELPGLKQIGETRVEDARQSEVRSLVRVAYELLTGITPGEQIIEPSKLVDGLSSGWDRFVLEGLDAAAGYASLSELTAALDGVTAKPAVIEVKAKRVPRLGLIRRSSGV